MEQIGLGLKIKQLRKERKLTQEMLAGALDVTPQAVSKWEMNLTYPDITLIPVIANYFEVSLDTLFDFDPSKKNERIKAIIDEANELFFDNTKACIEKIKFALMEYPYRLHIPTFVNRSLLSFPAHSAPVPRFHLHE